MPVVIGRNAILFFRPGCGVGDCFCVGGHIPSLQHARLKEVSSGLFPAQISTQAGHLVTGPHGNARGGLAAFPNVAVGLGWCAVWPIPDLRGAATGAENQ